MMIPSAVAVASGLQNFSLFTLNPPATTCVLYMMSANIVYLARRANIRRESMGTMLRYRTQRESGVSIPLYLTFLVAWQTFVMVFPVVEPVAKVCLGCCCLFYSYPNASGCGIILEPLDVQHLPLTKRSKHQIRLDWHRFSINVGPIGRDGYRHPPSRNINRPHIDIPRQGIKHWPWKRKYISAEPNLGRRK